MIARSIEGTCARGMRKRGSGERDEDENKMNRKEASEMGMGWRCGDGDVKRKSKRMNRECMAKTHRSGRKDRSPTLELIQLLCPVEARLRVEKRSERSHRHE